VLHLLLQKRRYAPSYPLSTTTASSVERKREKGLNRDIYVTECNGSRIVIDYKDLIRSMSHVRARSSVKYRVRSDSFAGLFLFARSRCEHEFGTRHQSDILKGKRQRAMLTMIVFRCFTPIKLRYPPRSR